MHLQGTDILPLIYFVLTLLFIRRFTSGLIPEISKQELSLFFLLKVLTGFALTWLYSSYYTQRNTADIFKYFDDSLPIYNALKENPGDYFSMLLGIGNNTPHFDQYYDQMYHWQREYDSNIFSDSHLIIRFNAFVRLFSFGNFHVHTIAMNVLSFLGLIWLIQFFNAYINRPKLLTYALFLTPSLLFWSSGVLKEGIIVFALGLLLKYTNKLVKEFKLQFIVLIAFAIGLLIYTKIYIALILAPGLICWFIDERFSLKFRFIHYFGFYFGIFLLIYLTTNPIDRLVQKQHDLIENAAGGTYIERQSENQCDTIFIAASKHELIRIRQKSVSIDTSIHFAQEVKHGDPGKCISLMHNNKTNYRLLLDIGVTGSDFNMKPLEPNLIDLLSQTPASLANVFLRPFPNELTSPLQIISFSENLIIVIIILITLIKNSKNKLNNLEIMSILFVLILFWVIGITTPIAGAIMRYKVIGYVFLIPILIQRIKKVEPQTCDSTL